MTAEIQNYENCSQPAIDPLNLTSNMCSSNADVVETESLESVFSNSNEANCEFHLEENCHSQYDQCSNDFLFIDLCPGSVLESIISDTKVNECEIQSQITDWSNKKA